MHPSIFSLVFSPSLSISLSLFACRPWRAWKKQKKIAERPVTSPNPTAQPEPLILRSSSSHLAQHVGYFVRRTVAKLFPDSLLRVCRGLCNFGFGSGFGKLLGFVLIDIPYGVLGQQQRLTTRRTEETMHEQHNLHGFVFGYYYD
jgi:hypothetical protein